MSGSIANAGPWISALERGLRSSETQTQCSSIVQFSTLIQTFPFPVVVNTALLKLADCFCADETSNFLRWWIYTVFRDVEGQLQNVINAGELVRRITGVLRSNDPIARSITMKMISTMALIVAERKDLHHKIQTRLIESTERCERVAAVEAVERLSAVSPSFAAYVLDTLKEMLHDVALPQETKLHLISIFRHMNFDQKTITTSFNVLNELLEQYPQHDMILTILDTMSSLAQTAPSLRLSHMNLLFNYVQQDPRNAIKLMALDNITRLFRTAAAATAVTGSDASFPFRLLHDILVAGTADIQLRVFKLLNTICIKSPLFIPRFVESDLFKSCHDLVHHPDVPCAYAALHLLAVTSQHCDEDHVRHVSEMLTETVHRHFRRREFVKETINGNIDLILLCKNLMETVSTFIRIHRSSAATRITPQLIDTLYSCITHSKDDIEPSSGELNILAQCIGRCAARGRNSENGKCDIDVLTDIISLDNNNNNNESRKLSNIAIVQFYLFIYYF